MKKKFARLLASIGVGTMALVGFTGVSVATAEPAEAVTITKCRNVDGGWYYHDRLECYYDYNWWENVVLNKFDGWKTVYIYR